MKHCWTDWYEDLMEQEQMSQADSTKLQRGYSATCMLEAGHAGPHEWTDDKSIVVSFKDAEVRQ